MPNTASNRIPGMFQWTCECNRITNLRIDYFAYWVMGGGYNTLYIHYIYTTYTQYIYTIYILIQSYNHIITNHLHPKPRTKFHRPRNHRDPHSTRRPLWIGQMCHSARVMTATCPRQHRIEQ